MFRPTHDDLFGFLLCLVEVMAPESGPPICVVKTEGRPILVGHAHCQHRGGYYKYGESLCKLGSHWYESFLFVSKLGKSFEKAKKISKLKYDVLDLVLVGFEWVFI